MCRARPPAKFGGDKTQETESQESEEKRVIFHCARGRSEFTAIFMDGKAGITEQAAGQPSGSPEASARARCPACDVAARRVEARFCSACGRSLDESYLPINALRASYNAERSQRDAVSLDVSTASVKPLNSSLSTIFPARNSNGASTTALAFVIYSLVPYLGILFCPGAVLMGGVGLLNSYRAPERGGRRASSMGLVFGVLIFCAQLFLWRILYKIPEWAKQ